jgi:hypothetical protein
MLVAAAACWSLWLCQNNLVFEKKKNLFALSFAGNFFGNPLAMYMSYPPKALLYKNKKKPEMDEMNWFGCVLRQKPETNSLLLYLLDIMMVN